MNDNTSNNDHSGISLPRILYKHMVSIFVADVYVYSLEEWLLRGSLLLCHKKLKYTKFSKRLEAAIVNLT